MRSIDTERTFKYNLLTCSKNPHKKADLRKKLKQKKDLSTSSGMPIFSTYNIYKHYLTISEWERAM